MGRAPCCDKANVKRGPWSPEEDAKLKAYIEQHGTGGNWIALPQKIGLKRCGKSCRLRWLNYLRPNIKHGGFTEEEDNIICSLYINIGSRWSIIAAQLPGRTDNDIKNYWNTRLKKKFLRKPQRKVQQEARRSMSFQRAQEIKGEGDHHHHHHLQDNNFIMFPESTTLVMSQTQTQAQNTSCSISASNSPHYHYQPEVAAAGLVMMNQDYHLSPVNNVYNDQAASIRNLLIKLGGRFSNDNPHQQPITNSLYPPIQMVTPQNQLHPHSSSMANSTCTATTTTVFPHHQLPTNNIIVGPQEAGPDQNDMFVQEIENLAVVDHELDDLELERFLFEMEMMMSTSTTTGTSTPSTESTISSLGDMIITDCNTLTCSSSSNYSFCSNLI